MIEDTYSYGPWEDPTHKTERRAVHKMPSAVGCNLVAAGQTSCLNQPASSSVKCVFECFSGLLRVGATHHCLRAYLHMKIICLILEGT